MAQENLFPSPIPSPDLVDLEEVTLTPEERKITDKLGWTHKFDNIVSSRRTNRVRWLVVLVPFLTLLINAPGGFDIFERIVKYISVRDFLLLAAASGDLLAPYLRPKTSLYRSLLKDIGKNLSACQIRCDVENFAVSTRHFVSLTQGSDLLREYRLFKEPLFEWKIDDSSLFHFSSPQVVEFHPTRPIVAMVNQNPTLYILAYGGEERRTRGQIMYVESQPPHSRAGIIALNWSPNGNYLLALESVYDQIFEKKFVSIHLCEYKQIV